MFVITVISIISLVTHQVIVVVVVLVRVNSMDMLWFVVRWMMNWGWILMSWSSMVSWGSVVSWSSMVCWSCMMCWSSVVSCWCMMHNLCILWVFHVQWKWMSHSVHVMETVRIFMPIFVIVSSTMFKVMVKVLMPVLFNLMSRSLIRKKGLNIMMFNSMLGLVLNIVEKLVVLVLDILH